MLLTAELDTFMANEAIKSGELPKIMEGVVGRLKPEAAYFTVANGCRTAYLVIDVTDVSQMPTIGEPFFVKLGARVTLTPVMNAEDLGRGLTELESLGL
jgi:hypothetical protein